MTSHIISFMSFLAQNKGGRGLEYQNTVYSDKLPDWYWAKGLHDAQITERKYYPPEKLCISGISKYLRNCLEIHLDATQALFDISVKAIRFYNYKELTPDVVIEGSWWVTDAISQIEKKFTLEITCFNGKCEVCYMIRFEKCEIVR